MQHKEIADNAKNLKELGLKATGPRLKILEMFQKKTSNGTDRHMSAEEVYKELVDAGEDVGLATVYRVLAQFASAGILIRRNFEHGTALFELDDGHHHDHLICVMCGKVVEFIDEEVEKRQFEIAQKHGYSLVDHSMALYGVCPACRDKNKKIRARSFKCMKDDKTIVQIEKADPKCPPLNINV